MKYTQSEKVGICLDISNKLKNFTNSNGVAVNLFNDNYTFISKLKSIFNDYIKGSIEYRGTLEFEEIGKNIEYHFPINKKQKPLFVIRIK